MGNIDRKVIRIKEFDSLDLKRVQEVTIKTSTTKRD